MTDIYMRICRAWLEPLFCEVVLARLSAYSPHGLVRCLNPFLDPKTRDYEIT